MAGAGGAALAPPQSSEEGETLPNGGRGRSPHSPSQPASPGLNAAAASARFSCLAVPASGTLPALLPGPAAQEAPPVGSALRSRLRVVRQAQVSQRAWGHGGVRGAAGVKPDQATVFNRGCTNYGAPI